MKIHTHRTATIAAGQTVSGEVELDNFSLVGIWIPATYIGTTVTFQVAPTISTPGTTITFAAMKDGAGSNYSKVTTTLTYQYIPLSPQDFSGVRAIKFVSNATETTGAVITLATRQIA